MTHYIHRPMPEGGEEDARFREVTVDDLPVEAWHGHRLQWRPRHYRLLDGTIWRIPGSDAPSAEMLKLAEEVREG